MTLLGYFTSVLPRAKMPQHDHLHWLSVAHAQSATFAQQDLTQGRTFEDVQVKLYKLIQRYGVSPTKIHQRYFEVDHDSSLVSEERNIYKFSRNSPAGMNLFERHEFYQKRVFEVLSEIYETRSAPDHFVHVSCTGYTSPSAPQMAATKIPKIQNMNITHSYHMGCYAALPSVRAAFALSKQYQHSVDIVHNELCTLHLNPLDHSPEQIVVQTLFADGHIAYRIDPHAKRGFKIVKIQEERVPDSWNDMTWTPGPLSMNMTLSRQVPEKIATVLKPHLAKLLNGVTLSKEVIYAIHPGGPKIIERISELLGLSEKQISFSKNVLQDRGNMSSATLPHIWKLIFESSPPTGTQVISMAFGPGLTIFSSLMEFVDEE